MSHDSLELCDVFFAPKCTILGQEGLEFVKSRLLFCTVWDIIEFFVPLRPKGMNMEYVKLDPKTIDTIARKSAKYVLTGLEKKRNNDKEMVTAAEAARILGISQSYLRSIKDNFRYVKGGGSKMGRILFEKDSLIKNYIKERTDRK